MLYRLKTTNEVVTQGELRRRNSNMSLPSTFDTATLELLGVEQVIDNGPMPVSVLQECVSVGVEPTAEGVLVVKYVVRDKFSDITTTDENGQVIVVKTKAEQEAEALEDERKASVPSSITPRQARLALLQAGLLDEIDEAVKANRAWQITWEYATEVNRNDPLIKAVGEMSGMSDEQLDQLFIEASKL